MSAPPVFDSSLGAFIRGMRVHDLAKPFFLEGRRHALAGFLVLSAAGRASEALYALLHHATKKEGRTSWLEEAISFLVNWHNPSPESGFSLKLPYWTCLSPFIDMLAASTYSGFAGKEPKTNIWAIVNPFSRLPQLIKDGRTFGKNRGQELSEVHSNFWKVENPYCIYPRDSYTGMRSFVTGGYRVCQTVKETKENLGNWVNAELARRFVEEFYAAPAHTTFPERTYPSANDTALLEHGSLSAALALVVGGNILLGNSSPEPIELVSSANASTKLAESPVNKFEWNDYKHDVFKNLEAYLLRLSFAAYEDLFHQAVRLDDLHGVRTFQDALKQRFIINFHLEIAGLIDGSDNGLAAALAPLNDFPFDLVYLLPGKLEEQAIRNAAQIAYRAAATEIAEALNQEYHSDFKPLTELLSSQGKTLPQLGAKKLCQFMRLFSPDCLLEKFGANLVAGNSPEPKIEQVKEQLAESMRQGYQRLWGPPPVSGTEAENIAAQIFHGPEDEICDVCGRHGSFKEFYDLYKTLGQGGSELEQAKDFLEKVIYSHQEEPEHLCPFCLARRLWSHGRVQETWLQQMLEHVEQGDRVLVRVKAALPPGPTPPPRLQPQAIIDKPSTGRSDKVNLPQDMGACFIRWRNRLQVYPTIAAVGDADANVALLYLVPDLARGVLGDFDNGALAQKLASLLDITGNRKYQKIFQKVQKWQTSIGKGGKDLIGVFKDANNFLQTYQSASTTCPDGHPLQLLGSLASGLTALADDASEKEKRVALQEVVNSWQETLRHYTGQGDSDLERFEGSLAAYVGALDLQKINVKTDGEEQTIENYIQEAKTARPHLARVLTRIRWIDEFFQDLSRVIGEELKVRILRLETAYPRLMLAAPAADLVTVLESLHRAMAYNLFSSTLYGSPPSFDPSDRKAQPLEVRRHREWCLWLLKRVLPTVLKGAVVVFKERQPLYHVLDAAREVVRTLQPASSAGFNLGLIDLRGGLGGLPGGSPQDMVTMDFCQLYELLEAAPHISRRPLMALAALEADPWGTQTGVREAALYIKKGKQSPPWTDREMDALLNQDLYRALSFIKTVTKT